VAKTVNDPAFVAWLVDKRVPEYLNEHKSPYTGKKADLVKCATDVHAAIDAIKAHDGAAFFNCIPDERPTLADLLYKLLVIEEDIAKAESYVEVPLPKDGRSQPTPPPKALALGIRRVKEGLRAAHVHMVRMSAPHQWYLSM
jgi:hypothetical protein